jgi:hypothetical protein
VMSLGRYRWLYQEINRLLLLSVNSGFETNGQHVISVLLPKNVRWEKPYEDDLIDEEEYESIKANLREAIAALEPNSLVEFHE